MQKLLPQKIFSAYHYLLAFSAACLYRFPARKLTVIGVTGTNGKTTTVHMMHDIFNDAGHAVCSASSVRFAIGNGEYPNMLKMTMAGPFIMQKFLQKAVGKGCRFAILEITSEGILQHREAFIPIDTAVLTNISPEHIERHGSFEAYRNAKFKIFKHARCMLINCDDKEAEFFLRGRAQEKYGYILGGQSLSWFSQLTKLFVVRQSTSGEKESEFTLDGFLMRLPLPGEFNIRNAAEASIVAHLHGIAFEKIYKTLEDIHAMPGRMEIVAEHPLAVVDYAHTPVALEEVYKTVQAKRPEAGRICVLGAAGGGRDKWKRPEFGKLAARYCSHIILTDEDPYDENPLEIIAEVRSGIPASFSGEVEEILDRKEAIAKAVKIAKNDDAVIITGKGCEPYMVTKEGKVPWDDRALVREAMEGRR